MLRFGDLLFFLLLSFSVYVSVKGVEYDVTWHPHRVAHEGNVTITFQLNNFTSPLASISLRFFYEFFIAENKQCRSVRTSGAAIEINKCDFDNALFEVKLLRYVETKTFTIHAYGQDPPNHKFIVPMYKRPNALTLNVPQNILSGMVASLRCEFDLGQNNLANFSWYRVNATRAIPYGRIGEFFFKKDRQRRLDFYGHVSHFEFVARPGDEGYYQCNALYNPTSEGKFFSKVVYLDIKYAPQIDMNKDYFTDHDVKIGEKVLLNWSILSNPLPAFVFWSRNGVILKNNAKYRMSTEKTDFGVSLSLKFKANWDTFGTFFCFVNNTMGSTQIYFHVGNIDAKAARSTCSLPTPKVVVKSDSSLDCRDLEFDRNLWRIVALSLMAFILIALIYGAIWAAVSSRKRKKVRIDKTQDQVTMKRVV